MADSSEATPRLLHVVGAAIVKNEKILCAERGEGKTLSGYWEFPGGKIEADETPQAALVREIQEELNCRIAVLDRICSSHYDYKFGRVILTVFECRLVEGEPQLTEHSQLKWLSPQELSELKWAPADRPAARMLIQGMNNKR
ncbi:DNA mismatch repair protein MutT [Bifidobacterium aemilianum]|uniref:8-oxo-dGTP diphosphatase n=1 Tax=Bifidobacterium aemilianum TaxID=2493120 RepID=A0A366KBY1_9BIFI|nr:(deoxy)nucleoside triphosphate pyrophosphohydrolase [Bifidobacterium aemilianum]RBP98633.1 DNA mismatch repair protein MutT [Bifidobacterium aemilianum]